MPRADGFRSLCRYHGYTCRDMISCSEAPPERICQAAVPAASCASIYRMRRRRPVQTLEGLGHRSANETGTAAVRSRGVRDCGMKMQD